MDIPSILIVEDDDEIAYLLRFMLTREGYDVSYAADGNQAFDLVSKFPAHSLVLLDVMLPYRDGFQLIGHIRATPAWHDVPVIVLTAKSQEKDIVRALDAGANDYVTKPFLPVELLARVKRHLKPSAK